MVLIFYFFDFLKVVYVFEFDLSAKYIFELIKEFGCNSQEIIISKASQHFGISEEEAECSITEFISLLKESKIAAPEAFSLILELPLTTVLLLFSSYKKTISSFTK